MVNRLSVNVLLKSVIAIMGAAVMTTLLLSAWGSWSRLQIANQIAAAADSSKYLFTTLHNLRTDRGMTNRELLADRQTVNGRLAPLRTAQISALKSALVALEAVDFPDRQAVLSELSQATRKLAAGPPARMTIRCQAGLEWNPCGASKSPASIPPIRT